MLAALLLALLAGKARGTELPFGAAVDYFNEMAHVDDSFHDVLANDGDEWYADATGSSPRHRSRIGANSSGVSIRPPPSSNNHLCSAAKMGA